MRQWAGLFALTLAACDQASPAPTIDEAATPTVAEASSVAPTPAPIAFVANEKNDLIDFHFGWSAEAAAVPVLVERFTAEMNKLKAELVAGAKEDKAWRDKQGLDFHGFMLSIDYNTTGQSDRLLSLSHETGSYTGGAHGNHGVSALLWDRQSGREVSDKQLFTAAENRDRLLTQRWCDALNKTREERRGEPVGGNDLFDDCPKLDEIALLPTDEDSNGRFERLILVAPPYVAGPYAEGLYEIDLPVTADLIAVLKGDYRPSFETSQPQ